VKTIRYYKKHRVTWNEVNRLWWFKTIDSSGNKIERCANTFRRAQEKIDGWELPGIGSNPSEEIRKVFKL